MTADPAVPVACAAAEEASEAGSLARAMVRAYRDMATGCRDLLHLSPAEAEARARAPVSPERLGQLRTGQPDQVSWWHLSALTAHDPEAAAALWQHLQREAHHELASGHRAAKVLDGDSSPWERARFLAVRALLLQQWQPVSGIEQVLIDTLAQAQTMYLDWFALLQQRTCSESKLEQSQITRSNAWEPPRLDRAAAIEEAMMMVDRWNRLFLRTLRQLRDLRRYAPTVVVQNVGQLNIGQQQMNVTPTDPASEERVARHTTSGDCGKV